MTWGEQADVPESAGWFNADYLLIRGSNVPQTRTPDADFYTEARYRAQSLRSSRRITRKPQSSAMSGWT